LGVLSVSLGAPPRFGFDVCTDSETGWAYAARWNTHASGTQLFEPDPARHMLSSGRFPMIFEVSGGTLGKEYPFEYPLHRHPAQACVHTCACAPGSCASLIWRTGSRDQSMFLPLENVSSSLVAVDSYMPMYVVSLSYLRLQTAEIDQWLIWGCVRTATESLVILFVRPFMLMIKACNRLHDMVGVRELPLLQL